MTLLKAKTIVIYLKFKGSLQKVILNMAQVFTCPQDMQWLQLIKHFQVNHNLWPPTPSTFIGLLLLAMITLLTSIAGLGGGALTLPILISIFNYSPRDASIVSFCVILGSSIGNVWNFMLQSQNGKPLIKYDIIMITLPLMFGGAVVGVIMNRLFPGCTIIVIGVYIFLTSVGKVYSKFRAEYAKQNEEKKHAQAKPQQNIRQKFNPFKDSQSSYILLNLLFLTVITIFLSLSRGSEKFPSLLGIKPCSQRYWVVIIYSFFLLLGYSYRNLQQIQGKNSKIVLSINKSQMSELGYKSLFAGILSGFGLGGGMILVPAYRQAGLNSFEATATCGIGICLTAFINCIQGIAIGIIDPKQFIFFVGFLSIITFICSGYLSQQLRKRNRMSYITGLFFCFLCIGMVNIPISVYKKYAQSGYDNRLLFGFGSFC